MATGGREEPCRRPLSRTGAAVNEQAIDTGCTGLGTVPLIRLLTPVLGLIQSPTGRLASQPTNAAP